ncbi:MAG: hypothetical protein IPL71_23910 [Anaerolineales bacterium]|uniref:hypothetical protein n=1 Tax=Candidatus Villigracilis proximus TaxID=3140683 RepID=UPI0031358739|nr:hypothetical protein [Anaerolineales bacterium]
MKIAKIVLVIFALTLVVSCMPNNQITSVTIAERLLLFPVGYYEHVVYINNHIVGFTSNTLPLEKSISFAYEGEDSVTPFNPEDDPKCTTYSYFQVVSILPDGRLGLLKVCRDNSSSSGFLSTNRSIYAYNWQTGELERLVAGKLTQADRPKFYSWNLI